MFPNCFQIYFHPIYLYVKRLFLLAVDNEKLVIKMTVGISITIEGISQFLGESFFLEQIQ